MSGRDGPMTNRKDSKVSDNGKQKKAKRAAGEGSTVKRTDVYSKRLRSNTGKFATVQTLKVPKGTGYIARSVISNPSGLAGKERLKAPRGNGNSLRTESYDEARAHAERLYQEFVNAGWVPVKSAGSTSKPDVFTGVPDPNTV